MHSKMLSFVVMMLLISGIEGATYVYCEDAPQNIFEYSSKGKRDPFVPLIGQEKPKIFGLADITSIEEVRLEGIAIGAAGHNIAILNGQMVKENDVFGCICIKKISLKSVELSIEDSNYTLTLQEPDKGIQE